MFEFNNCAHMVGYSEVNPEAAVHKRRSGTLSVQNPVAVVVALGLAISGACRRVRAYEKVRIVLEWRVMAWWGITRHRGENGL